MIREGIEPGHSPRHAWPLHVSIALGAAACIGIVFWQLLYNGPFRWHVSLPQFWQGGIEALILGCALAAWSHPVDWAGIPMLAVDLLFCPSC